MNEDGDLADDYYDDEDYGDYDDENDDDESDGEYERLTGMSD